MNDERLAELERRLATDPEDRRAKAEYQALLVRLGRVLDLDFLAKNKPIRDLQADHFGRGARTCMAARRLEFGALTPRVGGAVECFGLFRLIISPLALPRYENVVNRHRQVKGKKLSGREYVELVVLARAINVTDPEEGLRAAFANEDIDQITLAEGWTDDHYRLAVRWIFDCAADHFYGTGRPEAPTGIPEGVSQTLYEWKWCVRCGQKLKVAEKISSDCRGEFCFRCYGLLNANETLDLFE